VCEQSSAHEKGFHTGTQERKKWQVILAYVMGSNYSVARHLVGANKTHSVPQNMSSEVEDLHCNRIIK